MFVYVLLLLLAFVIAGFFLGRFKARGAGAGADIKMHSLEGYHGWFVAAWAGLPALILALLWILFQGPVIDWLLVGSLPHDKVQGAGSGQLQLLVSQIKSVAAGNIFSEPEPFVVEAAERYNCWRAISNWSMIAVVASLALAGLLIARGKVALNQDLDRQMFPFATPSEIADHVGEVFEGLYLKEGGLMLIAECGPDVPLENIDAICSAFEKLCNLPDA